MTAACEREGCAARFKLTHPLKRFCSEHCRRAAECRRYRARHTQQATCPHCGTTFERTTTTRRKQVYCSLECQYEQRSADYQARPDIQAALKRASRVRRRKAQGQPAESVVLFS